jgi:uncharacterized membrane protein HdeD (DUF308 family)
MEPKVKEPWWGWAIVGFLMLVFGVGLLVDAYKSSIDHHIIYFKAGWLSPKQAYIAGALCIVSGVVTIFVSVSQRRSK